MLGPETAGEGGRQRTLRAARGAASRRRPDAASGRRTGARPSGGDIGQPQRWETLRGSLFYAHLGGLRAPTRRTLGSDIAGWVLAVGEGLARFRPGDQVYGDNLALKGGFVDYAVMAESSLAHKPAALMFAQASTIPQAGAIALQGTDGAEVGRRVFIKGAGGGWFAIQLAKRLGAHVTGVYSDTKLEFMRSLGRRGDRLPRP